MISDPASKLNDCLRIGVCLELTWNFKRHTDIFAGVFRYAQEQDNWQCIVDDFAADTMRRSDSPPYDGIIGRISSEIQSATQAAGIPTVNVWASSPVKNAVLVTADSAAAGVMAAEHMLNRGIRNFVAIVRRTDRAEGAAANQLMQLVTEAGSNFRRVVVAQRFAHAPTHWRNTRTAIERVLDEASFPIGIMVGVDILGRYAAQICSERGLRVPEDVAIVGGYNESTVCLYPEPTLSSVEYGQDRVGYEAARTLDQLLQGKSVPERTLIPPQELIVRRSSDFVYVEDTVVSVAMQYIAKQAHRRLGVDDVAEAASTSRRTLEARFEKHVGRTVAAEIRRVRIDHAKRLLTGSKLSITRIAKETGIGSVQQLARVFRRETGISPREFRRQRMV